MPRGYEYRVDGGSAVDAGNNLSAVISGLTASTEYDVEVRKRDEAGNVSAWSSIVSQTTAAGSSGITVGNVTVTTKGGYPFTSETINTHNNDGDYLLVDVAMGYGSHDAGPSGITWNGVALTKIGTVTQVGTGNTLTRWRLVGADAGTQSLVITYASSGSNELGSVVTIRSFDGVNSGTPEGTTVSNTAVAATSISVNASSASGEIVVDGVFSDQGLNPLPVLTVGADQTQQSNTASGWGSTNLNTKAGTSYEDGAGTVTMSWTTDTSANLAILATPLKP